MNLNETAALIVALTGALAAVFAGLRNLKGDKFRKEVEASAALLTGYTTMVATLQSEIERLQKDCADDRASFNKERTSLREEHRTDMAALRSEHRAELVAAYARIDELGAKVYALQHRPHDSRNRTGDA